MIKRLKKLFCMSLIVTGVMCTSVNAITISNRLQGADRYGTAVSISKLGWANGSDSVVIATGGGFPDALSAAPLAKAKNAPILLTSKDTLPNDTLVELNRLKQGKSDFHAYLIGGTSVISSKVEQKLTAMGINFERVAGADRYETAVKVAEKLNSTEVFVTTGSDFSDALSAGPIAAAKGAPILLVQKDQVPTSVGKYLAAHTLTKSYIVGSTDLISTAVESKFPSPDPIREADKYARNIALIEKFCNDSTIKVDTTYFATGNDYADALTGAVLASLSSSPVVLVGTSPAQPTVDFIADQSFQHANVLGGEKALPSSIIQALQTADDRLEVVGID